MFFPITFISDIIVTNTLNEYLKRSNLLLRKTGKMKKDLDRPCNELLRRLQLQKFIRKALITINEVV